MLHFNGVLLRLATHTHAHNTFHPTSPLTVNSQQSTPSSQLTVSEPVNQSLVVLLCWSPLREHMRTCLGSDCNKLSASSSFSCLIGAVTSLRRVSPTSATCCLISLICMALLQVGMLCIHMHIHTYIVAFL